MWKVKLLLGGLVLILLLSAGCARKPSFESQLSSVVKPYRFATIRWEAKVISNDLKQWVLGNNGRVDDEVRVVLQYFSYAAQTNRLKANAEANNTDGVQLSTELNELGNQRLALEDSAERIIERQIREALAEQGIFHPLDNYVKLRVSFPPLNFKLDQPPHLLVISPRDRIKRTTDVMLMQNISLKDMESIENQVDRLGVSSLVVGLGGLGATYPTFVTNDTNLLFTIDTAVHEWLHQYLAFKPLGFRYLLDLTGISRNHDIATINETVASMVGKEIGALVYEKYYARYDGASSQKPAVKPKFDFDREMREIRIAVDNYLAQGEIEQAEEFMEQKRQYLATMGYHLRKLNQAYFAFYGTYADGPSSVSPIGTMLRELRSQSPSLKDFLNRAAAMTSLEDLQAAVKGEG